MSHFATVPFEPELCLASLSDAMREATFEVRLWGKVAHALAELGVERVIYDAPLLIENRLHEGMDGVVLVWVPREVQKARLMGRDGLDEAAAEARLAAQLPLDEKRQHATWLVDNSGDLGTTRARVEEVWRAMLARG